MIGGKQSSAVMDYKQIIIRFHMSNDADVIIVIFYMMLYVAMVLSSYDYWCHVCADCNVIMYCVDYDFADITSIRKSTEVSHDQQSKAMLLGK